MPMDHKAYSFDWSGFESNLHPFLVAALTANDSFELEAFIDKHLVELKDPYEGSALTVDWRDGLENRDVQEYGDYALTKFYDPTNCWGLGYAWRALSENLPVASANAMLGFPVGPAENFFDPGRCGAYFQTPEIARESLTALQPHACGELARYLELLERCISQQHGVYVTF